MTRDGKKVDLCLSLLAIGLTSCAPLGAVTSLATTALAGTLYVRSQAVERTFVASMPEVKEACHRALAEMAFTIKQEEAREDEYYILAAASDEYEVDLTITPITSRATRISVKADSLPERDKATGIEIINQVATALSPPPPLQLFVSPTNQTGGTVPLFDRGLPHIPRVTTVEPAPPESPTNTGSPPLEVKFEPSAVRLSLTREPSETSSLRMEGQEETFDRQQMYEAAINDYIEGDFPAAITNLRQYLASQPDRSRASKAHYWLGESHYSQREYAEALIQFETILRNYPRTPEAPRALLKCAQAYRQMGQIQQAEVLLRTLITQHSRSREAGLARTLTAGW